MTIRRFILTLVTTIAAIVATDRLLTRLAGPLPQPVAGESRQIEVDGTMVTVTEAGSTEGQELVMVHSPYLGASSREFAALSNALSDTHRMLLVDLPGFGRSDRPVDVNDTDRLTDAIAAVIETRTDEPILIASGQAYPAALAAAERTSIDRLVAIGPRTERGRTCPFRASILAAPVVGTAYNLVLTSRVMLHAHLSRTLEVPQRALAGDFLEYAWQSSHQPGSRASMVAWIGGDLDVVESLDELAGDTELEQAFIVGDRAGHPTVSAVRSAAERADTSVSIVSDTGAFPHLQAPDAVASHLNQSGLLARQ